FVCIPPAIFFFTAPAPTEIYTLSLHDALPISELQALIGRSEILNLGLAGPVVYPTSSVRKVWSPDTGDGYKLPLHVRITNLVREDRKSTRLNSSHVKISYAVFCLKKKKNTQKP